MRELLIELECELEVGRGPLCPGSGDVGLRLTVERGVHLDGVEMLCVVRELIERLRSRPAWWIEDPVPRPFPRRIVPAGGPDAERLHGRRIIDGCGIRLSSGKTSCVGSGLSRIGLPMEGLQDRQLTVNEIFYSIQG